MYKTLEIGISNQFDYGCNIRIVIRRQGESRIHYPTPQSLNRIEEMLKGMWAHENGVFMNNAPYMMEGTLILTYLFTDSEVYKRIFA